MGKIHQLYTAVAASYGMFLCGLMFVWPSYTSSLYTDKNTTLLSAPMTQVEISMIGSVPALGAMLGITIADKIFDAYGRRKGGMILTLPFLVSWTMIYLTKSSIVIVIARFIGGISGGAILVYSPVYISEVAEKSIRGFLGSVPVTFSSLGMITSYIFGSILNYQNIILANIVLNCLGITILLMVIESPTSLIKQKRETDACLAFARYRGVSPESKIVLEEISRLKTQISPTIELPSIIDKKTVIEESEKEKLKTDNEYTEKRKKVSVFRMIFTSKSTRRAFIVTGLTLSLQIVMGITIVQVYANDILSEALPDLSPEVSSIIVAAILLLGSFTSAAFADRFGRRIMLIISALIVVLCLISMGWLMQTNALPPWVMAAIIFVYCYAFNFGAGNVPYILLVEVFVPEVQSTAAMLLTVWMMFVSFVQLGVFPFIVNSFGVHVAFYIFSVFGTLDALAGIFLLPETKGLTNDQIQEAFLRLRIF